jgi:hypothetical protein
MGTKREIVFYVALFLVGEPAVHMLLPEQFSTGMGLLLFCIAGVVYAALHEEVRAKYPFATALPITLFAVSGFAALILSNLGNSGHLSAEDPRDMSFSDEHKFMDALAQSSGPEHHFYIFCVSDDSCRIADRYRDRLARAGWKNLPTVDPIACDGISILTFTEKGDQPAQVSDLTRAFAATRVKLNWENGSGATGATIGSTGPIEPRTRTTVEQNLPRLLKGPKDFAIMVGSLK